MAAAESDCNGDKDCDGLTMWMITYDNYGGNANDSNRDLDDNVMIMNVDFWNVLDSGNLHFLVSAIFRFPSFIKK